MCVAVTEHLRCRCAIATISHLVRECGVCVYRRKRRAWPVYLPSSENAAGLSGAGSDGAAVRKRVSVCENKMAARPFSETPKGKQIKAPRGQIRGS